MKSLLLMLTFMALTLTATNGIYGGPAMAEDAKREQVIYQAGSQPTVKGSSDYFTGNVTVQRLFAPKHPDAPFGAAYVTFEAGARSFWHMHPKGQHLIVTDGIGRTGTMDGKVEECKTGDALWCPAGVKHWHGASPTSSMTHIALTGALPDGKTVEWMEEVTDEQYKGGK